MLTEFITLSFAAIPILFRKKQIFHASTNRDVFRLLALWAAIFCFDYVYLGEGLLMTEINKPGSTILTHDKLGNHEGSVNCVYADGSVRAAATTATTREAFRKEREAAGDVILNEPRKLAEEGPKALPTYQ